MFKKILCLFVTLSIALCIFLVSCDDLETASTVADAFSAGADGWSYIGSASSEDECDAMSSDAGYSWHRFNADLGTCYGR